MNIEEKRIDLNTVNKLKYENLDNIEDSLFEDVYRKADKILLSIVRENSKFRREDGKDDHIANVVAFLGERGRGKSSAMLSFLLYLNKLQKAGMAEWSCFQNAGYEKVHFIKLPYIDAAMLAQNEFVIDVVLARMWDRFEAHMKETPSGSQDATYDRYVSDVKDKFANVRKAYIVLREKEKEAGKKAQDKDAPVASALHELSVSMNLRKEFENLVENYIKVFCYDRYNPKEGYLVLAIDDIDMGGNSAYDILEQIRRFLNIPKVIILLTADISRLRKVCENHYQETYKKEKELQRFINDYLEKVIPLNMRVHMPELKENHKGAQIKKDMLDYSTLDIKEPLEKDIILGIMAQKSGIYFDPKRRKRHFLQNDSLRNMVGYFEQLLELESDNSISWLKRDLRERIVEKVRSEKQKEFVESLFSKDYEDINNLVINYIQRNLQGNRKLRTMEKSLGQVLYACGLKEEENADNVEFVNCILMFYSIMLQQADEELKRKIVGNSIWGEWEYGIVTGEVGATEQLMGFESRSSLTLTKMSEEVERLLTEQKPDKALEKMLEENWVEIEAWLYALLFVNLSNLEDLSVAVIPTGRFEKKDEKSASNEVKQQNKDAIIFELRNVWAKRGIFGFLYQDEEKYYVQTERILKAMLVEFYKIIYQYAQVGVEEDAVEKFVLKMSSQIMKDMGMDKKNSSVENVFPLQNIEMLYSIGKVLGRENIGGVAESVDGKKMFEMVVYQYQNVQNELKARDEYYLENTGLDPKLAEIFGQRLQARFCLGEFQKTEELKTALADKFDRLLASKGTSVLNPTL